MIQPGKETNLPNSSSVGLQGMWGKSIYKVDGFSITMGIVAAVLVVFLLWQMYGTKGARRK
jgi:hypothetical protein